MKPSTILIILLIILLLSLYLLTNSTVQDLQQKLQVQINQTEYYTNKYQDFELLEELRKQSRDNYKKYQQADNQKLEVIQHILNDTWLSFLNSSTTNVMRKE